MLLNALLKHTTTLLSGTVLAQVITFAITIWLARYLYTAEDFGYMAIFTATTTILLEIANGRYNSAIMLPKSDQDTKALVGLCILISVLVSLGTAVITFGFTALGKDLIDPNTAQLMLFLPLAVLAGGVAQPLGTYLNRLSKYQGLAIVKVIQAVVTGGVSLALGYAGGFGALGLLYGYISGLLAAGLVTLALSNSSLPMAALFSRPQMASMARQYSSFPKFSIGSVLLNNVSKQAPVYILQLAYGAGVVGQFSLSYRMLATPVLLVTTSFSQVFFQNAARLYESNQANFLKLVVQTPRNLLLIGLLPILFLTFYGAEVFTLVFGAKWEAAGTYTQYLAPWILLAFITVPVTTVFDITHQLGKELLYNISLFVVRVAVLYWCVTHFSADYTVAAFGAVSAVMTGVLLLYVWQLAGFFKAKAQSLQYLSRF